MKNLFKTLLMVCTSSVFAQTADVVSTSGGTNDVYYKLMDGNYVEAASNKWHFAFTTLLIDASVMSNDILGVEVYLASDNIADWDKIDTTGKWVNRIYNSESSWGNGSFSNLGTSHPDYGWGNYNQSTHNIGAKRIFIIKLPTGEVKKMIIDKMETSGNVEFRIANIDGTDLKAKKYNKNTYKARNFVHYNLTLDSFIELEATSSNWELLFTKYYSEVAPGAVYPVSGVKINRDIKIAQRDGISVNSNDTNSLTYGSNITEIGSDWKSYNRNDNKYDITVDRAYFLKLKNGELWKVYFTNYTGGPSASYDFTKELISGAASINNLNTQNLVVYPNPSSAVVHFIFEANRGDWTVSVKDIMGNEVYNHHGSQIGLIDETILTHTFKPGVYWAEVMADGKLERKKIQIF